MARIDAQRKASRDAALETVKNLCKAYEFSATDFIGFIKATCARAATKKLRPRKDGAEHAVNVRGI
jgi:hypothetical protein